MINILNNLHQILSYCQNSINKIRSFNFPNQFYSSRFIFIHSKTKILKIYNRKKRDNSYESHLRDSNLNLGLPFSRTRGHIYKE